MRKIQGLIIGLLILIGVVATGEFYISYVYFFEDMTEVTFHLNGNSKEEFLDDTYKSAIENNINICIVVTETLSEYSSKKTIFCDESFKEYLEDSHYIYNGNHKGFFSGNVDIQYKEYKEVPIEALSEGIESGKYYLIGDLKDMISFKDKLVDDYGGIYPLESDFDSLADSREKVTVVWIIIAMVIIILSYYCVQVEKKEIIIRVTLGENINLIIAKNILIEFIEIFGTFLFISKLFSKVEYTGLLYERILSILVITFIVNSVIQLSTKFFDISLVMSNAKISREVIVMNYIVKLISTILVMVLMTSELSGIVDFYNYKKQEEFFSTYKGYKYVSLKLKVEYENDVEAFDKISLYEEKLYRENIDKYSIVYFNDDYVGGTRSVISANKNAVGYIEMILPELSNRLCDDKIYIIYNEDTIFSGADNEEITSVLNLQYNDEEEMDIEYIPYKDDSYVTSICMANHDLSQNCKNPVIVLNNRKKYSSINLEDENEYEIFFDEAFWKATDEEIIKAFYSISGSEMFEIKTSGVYETYEDRLMLYERVAALKAVLFLMVMIIQLVVSNLLVKMSYDANSVEIAIKKVLGHNTIARYKKMYIMTFTFIVIATGITFAFEYTYDEFTNTSNAAYIYAAMIVVTLVDFLIISKSIFVYEKRNIQKTLKGGCL